MVNKTTVQTIRKPTIRYSEAFKMEVVREMRSSGSTCRHMRDKYGIRGAGTVEQWARKYGPECLGKVIRVERPEEVNELKRLRQRVRSLESALADAHLELSLERAYTQLACEQAGIQDVAAFKKKGAGRPRIGP